MTDRLYYTDSFLTGFDAVITDIQELSRAGQQSLWRVALNRSAFYPTSGGQPFDTGSLTAKARSGAELVAEVVAVEEDERGEVWHHTAKPLSAGTPVRGQIDAARRMDHAQQHSGQHLLSAAFVQICNAPTVSFHLGEVASAIHLAIESISPEALLAVEELVNQVIAEDRLVSTDFVPRAKAEALLAAGEVRKLPAREGDLRIIEIANFDRNACGGTHVRSTGQVGGLHLRSLEKVRRGMRVEFVCGLRAMRCARQDFLALTEAARLLSAGNAEVPESISRIQTELKHAAKNIHALTIALASYQAAEYLRTTPVQNGLRLVRQTFRESSAAADAAPDAAYVKLLASQMTAQSTATAAILAWHPVDDKEPATVIFGRSGDLTFDCGALLKQELSIRGGRGGGSKDMAQGSVSQANLTAVLDSLIAACH